MPDEPLPTKAISLKQPWAALLVGGVKTIDIRRWSLNEPKELLIHAARVPDAREGVWALVPDHLKELASLRRGIIGIGNFVGCKKYKDLESFTTDQSLHLNQPEWFEKENGLYGLVFENCRTVPFRELPGNLRIFTVDAPVKETPTIVEPKPEIVEAQATPKPAYNGRMDRLMRSLGGKRKPGG